MPTEPAHRWPRTIRLTVLALTSNRAARRAASPRGARASHATTSRCWAAATSCDVRLPSAGITSRPARIVPNADGLAK